MKTFSINTLGCKVNQYESQQIREFLEQLGLQYLDTVTACGSRIEKPDLIIINTCCVTHTASAKSRQYIRKAQKLNPEAAIIISGCLAAVQIGELSDNYTGNIHQITDRHAIADTLVDIIESSDTNAGSQYPCSFTDSIIKAKSGPENKHKNASVGVKLPQITSFKGHSRAFLKVQDGCDGYCSYCIIPKTRPKVHSRPIEAVVSEAKGLAEAGYKEIVLTGVFLGAYGQRSVQRKKWPGRWDNNLAKLVEAMGQISNLERIRLSSLEPVDVTERLIDAFSSNPKVMSHLHLSIQSGSDSVLKRMCRQYGRDEIFKAIELIKSRLDRPAITADLIVGFPGEGDDDFEKTMDLARETGFAKMHVFSFSARRGTAAAKLQPVVNNEVIKERSQILHDLNIELGYKFRQQFVGERASVLVENANGQVCGRSERYFMVSIEKKPVSCEKNQIITVKLTGNRKDGMVGRIEA